MANSPAGSICSPYSDIFEQLRAHRASSIYCKTTKPGILIVGPIEIPGLLVLWIRGGGADVEGDPLKFVSEASGIAQHDALELVLVVDMSGCMGCTAAQYP